jgi:hypothetical protein
MNANIPVLWKDQYVGEIADARADMFHFYGRWKPADSKASADFMAGVAAAPGEIWVACGIEKSGPNATVEEITETEHGDGMMIEVTLRPK